jgi:hypothetical protein
MSIIEQFGAIAEPNAGDSVAEILNPIGRAYYAFSTLLRTPASLSQDIGLALAAQQGRQSSHLEGRSCAPRHPSRRAPTGAL